MTRKSYKIAVYPGDGIGVEVTVEAVKVLKAAEKVFGFALEMTSFDWGVAHWRRTGEVVPGDFLKTLQSFDAILLGALGAPAELPDHVTLKPLIQMRQGFEQYVCLRPAKLLPGVKTPLAGKRPGDIDLMVVRENSEGEYVSAGGRFKAGTPDEVAAETAIHTRKGVERILRYAFALADSRRRGLVMATKSNALKHSMVMWDEVFEAVRGDYPAVKAERFHVDALSMMFVARPEKFDVVVGSNLFGDILSDLAGGIVGGLGLLPSANINPEKAFPSLFEPVHGSAPDIAGKGIANPIGAIRAAAMMLDFLGEKTAAAAVEHAALDSLAAGQALTPDLGGTARTQDTGSDVAGRVRRAG